MAGYIKPLLSLSFWFKLAPDPLLPAFYYGFVIFFGLLIFASVACGGIYKQQKENYLLRFGAKYLKNWFLAAGAFGYLLIFFGYERAVFLSSRFWYIVWFLSFGLWLFFIIRKIKKLPSKQKEMRRQEQFERYLPKKK